MRRLHLQTINHKRSLIRMFYCRLVLPCQIIIVVLLIAPTHGYTQSENRIAWILVVDTSKSMIGVGGTEDIFSRVKSVVKDFIRNAKKGDTVVIYTFDRKPTLVSSVEIKGSFDKVELSDNVDKLLAAGQWTHTGDAVEKAFERSDMLKDQDGNPDKPVAVVIFTDDKEDHEPNSHSTFLSQIPLNREMPYPYTFVVWLNKKPPPLEITQFVDNLGDHGSLERIHDSTEINNIRDRVLEFLPPLIVINPSSLLFGSVEPGDTTDIQYLNIRTNRQTSLRIGIEGERTGIELATPSPTVVLKEGENAIPISLQTTSGLKDGIRDAKLVLVVDELVNGKSVTTTDQIDALKYEIVVSLNIAHVPWWRKTFKWSFLIASTLLVVWAGFFLLTGRHPPEVWVDYFRLEGELIILSPETIRGNKHISLTGERTNKIELSAIQVGRLKEYLEEDDAELTTAHKDGDKLIRIKALKGDLYVQDQRVLSADLYDEDIIKLGGLTMSFSGLRKRPSEYELLELDE
jgi:hypothetical protein